VSYLQSITGLNGADNIGGVLQIKVARKADIIYMADPVNGTIYGDIEFEAGKGFVIWTVTQDSPRALSDPKPTREGNAKSNKVDFRIPKDRADLRFMLDQAEQDEFIILFKDANGKEKIFGQLESPVLFQYGHDAGAKIPDGNFYQCSFYFTGPDNMFFYDGETETAPSGPVPSLVKYNGGTIAALLPGEIFNIESEFGFTNFYISS
jgi:hypothetical protein